MNSQKLPIMRGTFQALSPTELSVTLDTQLDTPLAADLDPTTLFVYNKDTPEYSPFLNVTLPKLHANHKTPVLVTNQTVKVTNETELVKWFDVQECLVGDTRDLLDQVRERVFRADDAPVVSEKRNLDWRDKLL